MATLENHLATNAESLGAVWVQPESLKDMIEADRIRIAGADNAILVEIDGETWTPPDAYRLENFFRPGSSSGLLDL